MVRLTLAIAALSLCACYAPAQPDCKVQCAQDGTCPHGLTCDGEYCRPPDHPSGVCQCSPGDERACGSKKGECRQGTQRCSDTRSWSMCTGGVVASPEVCDGKDNDCDDLTDEDPIDAPPCALDKGVCAGTVRACVNAHYEAACLAEYGESYQVVETRCDGVDNDCDGVVDRRVPVKLVDASDGYDLVGLDGGFALAYGSGTAWSVLLLDGKLGPLGPALPLGTTAGPTTIRGSGFDTVAWFIWQSPSVDAMQPSPLEAAGATVDLAAPSASALPLPGVSRPEARGAIKLAHTGTELLAAWPSDGGIVLSRWSSRGTAPMVSAYLPPNPQYVSAYEVGLSSRGSTLTFAGRFFTNDAGTVDYGDGVVSLADGGASSKFVYTGASIVDSPDGVAALYDGYCDYSLLGFVCRRSYVIADFDVWDPASVRGELRISAPGTITGSHAVSTAKSWVASWVENGELFIGVPKKAERRLATSVVAVGPLAMGQTRLASNGSELVALVYVANAASGQLNGVLICPP